MSTRQERTQRRHAQRKAKKAELKRLKSARVIAAPAVPLPELEEEFSPEFIVHAREVRERIQARLACRPDRAAPVPPADDSGFVSQTRAARRAETNRANAQHSTGPRSSTGKLASSRNSLKHGLASGELIIPGEDPAAFEALQTALVEEHQPATETETLLVIEMAQSWWLTQRALRLQNECFPLAGIDEKRLPLFLRYQTTHERAFHKALNTLLRLKQSRARERVADFVSQPRHFVRQKLQFPGFVSQTDAVTCPEMPAELEGTSPSNPRAVQGRSDYLPKWPSL